MSQRDHAPPTAMAPKSSAMDGSIGSRHVMVVSDDPNVITSLRRALEPLQPSWQLEFARSGTDALDQADNTGYDTIVADTRIRGMSCEDLLSEVRRRHSEVVRIALIGQADQAEIIRLLSVAQRVLPKPVDASTLQDAIRRAHSLRELLWNPALIAVVGRIGSIPTLSTLYNRIAEELAFADFSLAAVGELVEQDAGIAAKLIQVANSALLGLRRPAATPSQAVRVLGADLTRTLVLAADLFSRYDPAALRPFSIDALWEHSRQLADVAGRIAMAERVNERVVRDAAVAGLFHDIGRLTIASQLPGPYKEVLTLIRSDGIPAAEAEWRVLGASHAEIGGYLLGLWGLPDALVEAVAWHHDPISCPGETFSALTAVHVAEVLMSGDEGADLDEDYLERIGKIERLDAWKAIAGAPE